MPASKMPQVTYDREARILSIRLSKNKSVDSEIEGNVVLDYSANGKLVNVDIMYVSLADFRRVPLLRQMVRVAQAA